MKKRLIALAALMVLLLAACGSHQGGNGSKHPYSWKEKKDGSIELTIKNAPEDGYDWVASELGGILQIERTDDGTGNQAVFSVTGENPISETAIFDCRRETGPGDTSFEIQLQIGLSDKGRAKVLQTEYQQFPPVESAGEEGKPSCSWYSDTDGTGKLYLSENMGCSPMEYDETLLSVSIPSYGDSGCTYTLTGLAAGETSLLLYDLQGDYGFRLSVTVAEDLSVRVNSGQAGTFDIPDEQIPGMKEVTDYIGKLSIPAGYRIIECRSGDWNGLGQATDYASLSLAADGQGWTLYVTKDYSMAQLAGLYLDGDMGFARTETAVNGYQAALYSADEQCVLFWADDQGRSFCLSPLVGTVGQQALLAAANGLYSQEGA